MTDVKIRSPLHGATLLLAATLVAGCGGLRVGPFGREDGSRVVVPENATLYRCDAGRSFYLRFLATGEAWVILPGREFRLDKLAADSGTRYRGAGATLDLKGADLSEAALDDGPANQFTGCRRSVPG